MARRRLLVTAGSALVGLALAACAFLYCHRPARFTKEMAERIQPGMTEAEVVAILGWPAGNHADPETSWLGSGPFPIWESPTGWRKDGITTKGWISDVGAIGVDFGPDGRVRDRWWEAVLGPVHESPLDFVRRLFRRVVG
jgi:hypothetical protein